VTYNVFGGTLNLTQSVIYRDDNASRISIIIITQQYCSSTVLIATINQSRNVIIGNEHSRFTLFPG